MVITTGSAAAATLSSSNSPRNRNMSRKKIFVTGAGSAQSNGIVNCLLMGGCNEEVVGLGSDAVDLMFCRAHRRIIMPHSREPIYRDILLRVLDSERPDMLHFQHDAELAVALKFREEIENTGVRMLVPDYASIDTCVHKYKSWLAFRRAGIVVPENMVLNERSDVERALRELGGSDGRIWLVHVHRRRWKGGASDR